jgi:hypothetical protein
LEIGGKILSYHYKEPSLSVSNDGILFDISGRATMAYKRFFGIADISFGFGDVDYKGSGSANGEPVHRWDVRGLFGKDFYVSDALTVSPYLGVGYRTLFNDARGSTSTGASGYRRYNKLYYLPFGISPRTHIDSNSRLSANIEYDMVLHGNQTSYLSDAGFGDPDIQNGQSSGYGIRGEIMFERQSWSFGPVFNYWNIEKSKTKIAQDNSVVGCYPLSAPCLLVGDEPANSTIEAGIQFRYHLF